MNKEEGTLRNGEWAIDGYNTHGIEGLIMVGFHNPDILPEVPLGSDDLIEGTIYAVLQWAEDHDCTFIDIGTGGGFTPAEVKIVNEWNEARKD